MRASGVRVCACGDGEMFETEARDRRRPAGRARSAGRGEPRAIAWPARPPRRRQPSHPSSRCRRRRTATRVITVAQRDGIRAAKAPRTVDVSANGRFVAFQSWVPPRRRRRRRPARRLRARPPDRPRDARERRRRRATRERASAHQRRRPLRRVRVAGHAGRTAAAHRHRAARSRRWRRRARSPAARSAATCSPGAARPTSATTAAASRSHPPPRARAGRRHERRARGRLRASICRPGRRRASASPPTGAQLVDRQQRPAQPQRRRARSLPSPRPPRSTSARTAPARPDAAGLRSRSRSRNDDDPHQPHPARRASRRRQLDAVDQRRRTLRRLRLRGRRTSSPTTTTAAATSSSSIARPGRTTHGQPRRRAASRPNGTSGNRDHLRGRPLRRVPIRRRQPRLRVALRRPCSRTSICCGTSSSGTGRPDGSSRASEDELGGWMEWSAGPAIDASARSSRFRPATRSTIAIAAGPRSLRPSPAHRRPLDHRQEVDVPAYFLPTLRTPLRPDRTLASARPAPESA